MKRFFCWLLILAALVSAPLVPKAHARTVRLFIIGNSFSQNATRYLPQLAKEGGHELIIGRAELGGHSLERHWSYVEAAEANPEDPKGKPYGGKSLRMLLSQGTWNIVTLQQYSMISGNVETYQPYARKLYDFIKKLQPHAEVVLHQTWAYRSDAKTFAEIGTKQKAKDQREMWEKSHGAYHTIAEELGVRLIPVGDAFWKVSSDPQWAYKKDANFDFANPVHPTLPDQTSSLNVGYSWQVDKDGNKKFGFDANHANNAGCYLGALTWYGFLMGESPEKLKFTPPLVTPEFAAHLRQVAVQTLQGTPLSVTPARPQ